MIYNINLASFGTINFILDNTIKHNFVPDNISKRITIYLVKELYLLLQNRIQIDIYRLKERKNLCKGANTPGFLGAGSSTD